MKPARPEDIPQATHEGTLEMFGMKLRTYRLDDGRTLIHADDFHALMEHTGFAEFIHGKGGTPQT